MVFKRKYPSSSSNKVVPRKKQYTSNYNNTGKSRAYDGFTMPKIAGIPRVFWSFNKGSDTPLNAVRRIPLTAYTTSTSGATNAVYYFSLDQLPNYTEFTGMFDQYMIKKVDIQMMRMGDNETTAQIDGFIYVAPDFDDISATASAALQQYPQCQVLNWDQNLQISLIPRMAVAAYGGAFTSYMNKAATWIDCNSPSVQHYGLKMAADSFGGAAQKWEIIATYHLAFKSLR